MPIIEEHHNFNEVLEYEKKTEEGKKKNIDFVKLDVLEKFSNILFQHMEDQRKLKLDKLETYIEKEFLD